MALFCSECGAGLTERMRRCPRCGADILRAEPHKMAASVLPSIIIGMGIALGIGTLLEWYGISLNIDGGGGLDALANTFTRIFPGYSGISTTYGVVCFGMALAMVVCAACRMPRLTFVAAIGCVAVTTIAIIGRPDFMELNSSHVSSGNSVTELLDGPLPLSDIIDVSALRSASDLVEVGASYINIEIGYGLKIALMASVAAAIMALVDIISHSKGNRCKEKSL